MAYSKQLYSSETKMLMNLTEMIGMGKAEKIVLIEDSMHHTANPEKIFLSHKEPVQIRYFTVSFPCLTKILNNSGTS